MMKRHQLRFLLGLSDDIDQACQILAIPRAEFMANMTRFIDTVSLGIELGREMRGKSAKDAATIIGKPSPKAKANGVGGGGSKGKGAKKAGAKGKKAGGLTVAQRIAKVMGRRTMGIGDIATELKKAKLAPKSDNLRSYIGTTLAVSVDANGKKMFTSPARGLYFVTAKMSAREITRKKKAAAAAAAKAKTNGKAAKADTATTAAAAAAN